MDEVDSGGGSRKVGDCQSGEVQPLSGGTRVSAVVCHTQAGMWAPSRQTFR